MECLVSACYISRAVGNSPLNDPVTASVLADMKQVRVLDNKVLTAIMAFRDSWVSAPLLWVDNCPYKIRLQELTSRSAVLLQMSVNVEYKSNGKPIYHVINKRQVKIVFA